MDGEEELGGGAHHEKLMHRAIDIVCARPARDLDAGVQLVCVQICQDSTLTGQT